jgi:hypothetical protein
MTRFIYKNLVLQLKSGSTPGLTDWQHTVCHNKSDWQNSCNWTLEWVSNATSVKSGAADIITITTSFHMQHTNQEEWRQPKRQGVNQKNVSAWIWNMVAGSLSETQTTNKRLCSLLDRGCCISKLCALASSTLRKRTSGWSNSLYEASRSLPVVPGRYYLTTAGSYARPSNYWVTPGEFLAILKTLEHFQKNPLWIIILTA